jgi:hypothetical protein
MATQLTDMEIMEISLVDEPANDAARVEIFKSKKAVCKDDEKDPNEAEPDNDEDDASSKPGKGKKGAAGSGKKVPMAKVAGAVLAAIEALSDEIVAKALAGEFAGNPDAAEAAAFIVKETAMDLQSLQTALADAEGRIAELTKRADEAEAKNRDLETVVKAKDAELDKLHADNADEDEVLKSLPEPVRKRIEDANKAAAAAQEEVAKMRAAADEREAIEKAKAIGIGDAAKLGPLLMRIEKGKSGAEDAAEVTRLLKSAAELSAKSPLFKQFGSDVKVEGDPEELLKAKADEIRKGKPDLSPAQAYAKATEENPELYTAYVAKHRQRGAGVQ